MSENDKITEETANDTLPAEVETDLAEQETDIMPAEPEEEIAPEDVKIFGMPRHVFHWTAMGDRLPGGLGHPGISGEQLPGSLFETISGKTNATVWAVVVGAIGYFFSSRAYKKRKAAEESKKNTEQL